MITSKQMNKAQIAHENAGYAEWDSICEAADRREAVTDTAVEAALKDPDVVGDVIEQNADEFALIIMKGGDDVLDKLNELIECHVRYDIEEYQ